MKPANELTREEVAPALAEAQGVEYWEENDGVWTKEIEFLGSPTAADTEYKVLAVEINPFNDTQYNALTLNPEIHAGMIDVLDEWLSKWKKVDGTGFDSAYVKEGYQHTPEYQQDIRLWQLRAVVEYLRRQK